MLNSSRGTLVAMIAALAAALGFLFVMMTPWKRHEPAVQDADAPAAPVARESSSHPGAAPAPTNETPRIRPAPHATPQGPDDIDQPPDPYEVALRWSAVDLDAVRSAMPDNLYWQMSAPTTDEALLQWREEERARWNREYGKVLSGNVNEQEIDDYYAHRERVSLDAIEFASHLLDQYRDTLPERDVGLLELAIKLHHARLQEIPRRLAEARERKQRQDVLREAWLADEKAFEEALQNE